jgi:hypothetical protein
MRSEATVGHRSHRWTAGKDWRSLGTVQSAQGERVGSQAAPSPRSAAQGKFLFRMVDGSSCCKGQGQPEQAPPLGGTHCHR